MLSLLFSLGLSFGLIDQTDLSAGQVEQIAKQVVAEMQADMTNTPIVVVAERPEPTPMAALSYINGRCAIIINTNRHAWAQWGRFLNEQNREHWTGIIKASVAHEIGHCLKEGKQFAANYHVDHQEFQGIQSTGNLRLAPEMTYKQELFADAVAILYAREKQPDEAEAVISALVQAREKFSANEPTHNTAEMLHRLLAEDTSRLENEPIGVAASRLLSAL